MKDKVLRKVLELLEKNREFVKPRSFWDRKDKAVEIDRTILFYGPECCDVWYKGKSIVVFVSKDAELIYKKIEDISPSPASLEEIAMLRFIEEA